jgi:hypothetical protein
LDVDWSGAEALLDRASCCVEQVAKIGHRGWREKKDVPDITTKTLSNDL